MPVRDADGYPTRRTDWPALAPVVRDGVLSMPRAVALRLAVVDDDIRSAVRRQSVGTFGGGEPDWDLAAAVDGLERGGEPWRPIRTVIDGRPMPAWSLSWESGGLIVGHWADITYSVLGRLSPPPADLATVPVAELTAFLDPDHRPGPPVSDATFDVVRSALNAAWRDLAPRDEPLPPPNRYPFAAHLPEVTAGPDRAVFVLLRSIAGTGRFGFAVADPDDPGLCAEQVADRMQDHAIDELRFAVPRCPPHQHPLEVTRDGSARWVCPNGDTVWSRPIGEYQPG